MSAILLDVNVLGWVLNVGCRDEALYTFCRHSLVDSGVNTKYHFYLAILLILE